MPVGKDWRVKLQRELNGDRMVGFRVTAGGWYGLACLACSNLIARIGQTVWKDQRENATADLSKLCLTSRVLGAPGGPQWGQPLVGEGKITHENVKSKELGFPVVTSFGPCCGFDCVWGKMNVLHLAAPQ